MTEYKSSEEAETANIQQERDLQAAIKDLGTIETNMNALRRAALDIDVEIADLREPQRKCRENINRLKSELNVSKSEFFRMKRENL
jgi:predicted  nucleic acid-binding Zn-ribbon protein